MPKRSRSISSSSSGAQHAPEIQSRGRTQLLSPVSKYKRTTSVEPPLMLCDLPPHEPMHLPPEEFDVHYAREHTNCCSACSANLPSAWMLELHIRELHDPIVAADRESGENTFKCFVETCDRLCSAPARRRLHLIDKHQYPKDYDFNVVRTGITADRTTLLRKGRARSYDSRRDTGRRGGGLGKMTGRLSRRRSSAAEQPESLKPESTAPVSTLSNEAAITGEKPEHQLADLSTTLGKLNIEMTPRSLLIRKKQAS